jgi:hypothetical protein
VILDAKEEDDDERLEEVDASIPMGMELSPWCSESFSKSASRSEKEEKAMLRTNTQKKRCFARGGSGVALLCSSSSSS